MILYCVKEVDCMKQIIYYRTKSYGGMEGRDIVIRNFETLELAKDNALSDTWNDSFSLYEVTLIFDGMIVETETFIERIKCYRDVIREQSNAPQLNIRKRKKN